MELTDLKITAAEQKERDEKMGGTIVAESPSYTDRYPWGLELRLDSDTLKKLGIGKLPAVGTKMRVVCEAKVEEVRESDRLRDGEKVEVDRSMTLQVCKMGLKKGEPTSEIEAIDAGIDEAY